MSTLTSGSPLETPSVRGQFAGGQMEDVRLVEVRPTVMDADLEGSEMWAMIGRGGGRGVEVTHSDAMLQYVHSLPVVDMVVLQEAFLVHEIAYFAFDTLSQRTQLHHQMLDDGWRL